MLSVFLSWSEEIRCVRCSLLEFLDSTFVWTGAASYFLIAATVDVLARRQVYCHLRPGFQDSGNLSAAVSTSFSLLVNTSFPSLSIGFKRCSMISSLFSSTILLSCIPTYHCRLPDFLRLPYQERMRYTRIVWAITSKSSSFSWIFKCFYIDCVRRLRSANEISFNREILRSNGYISEKKVEMTS